MARLPINRMDGGQAFTTNLMGENQFDYSENIEVTTTGAKLCKALEAKVMLADSDLITCAATSQCKANIGRDVNMFFGSDEGNVYSLSGADKLMTLSGGDVIQNIIQYNDYILMFWRDTGVDCYITKIDVDDATQTGAGTWNLASSFVEEWKAPLMRTTSNLDKIPVIEFNNILYFGLNDRVYKLDNYDQMDIALDRLEGDIAALTIEGNFIKIVFRSGKIYFRDGISDNINTVFNINDTLIYAYSDKGYDYMISASGSVYKSTGTQYERISQKTQNIAGDDKFCFNAEYEGAITNHDGNMYFISDGEQGGSTQITTLKKLYPSGRFLWQNMNYQNINKITGVYTHIPETGEPELYVVGRVGETYGVFEHGDTYETSGSIAFQEYDLGDNTTFKKTREFEVPSDIPTNTTLSIENSIDGASYSAVKTISATSLKKNRIINPGQAKYLRTAPKIVFASTDNTVTPILKGFAFSYEPTEQ